MHQSKRSIFFISLLLLSSSCSVPEVSNSQKKDISLERFKVDPTQTTIMTYCTVLDLKEKNISKYTLGEIICSKQSLKHPSGYELQLKYMLKNKRTHDPYKSGRWELVVYKGSKVVKSINMRNEDDPAWFNVSFVRIRDKKYFSDINNDGYDEFAVFPFSSGSAAFGTIRIFSLNNLSGYGSARYHIEGDGHALFNCPKCSKHNFAECKKCN